MACKNCQLWCLGFLSALGLMLAMTAGQAQAAGPHIDEVWMRYGGARLQYSAVMSPQQMDLNGMQRKDPASFKGLPPIVPMKQTSGSRSVSSSRNPAPRSGLPAGQSVSPRPAAPAAGAVKAKPEGLGASRSGTTPDEVSGTSGGTGTATSKAQPNGAVSATPAAAPGNPSVARPEDKDAVFLAPPPAPRMQNGGTQASSTASSTAGSTGRAGANEPNGTNGMNGSGRTSGQGMYQARMGSGLGQ